MKQLVADCMKTGGEEDEIDLTSADSNAMFFRNHNAFEDEAREKEKEKDGIGDNKL